MRKKLTEETFNKIKEMQFEYPTVAAAARKCGWSERTVKRVFQSQNFLFYQRNNMADHAQSLSQHRMHYEHLPKRPDAGLLLPDHEDFDPHGMLIIGAVIVLILVLSIFSLTR